MRKINSVHYGGKILAWALFFLLAIPGILQFAAVFCKGPWLAGVCLVSAGIGIFVLAAFGVLLSVELKQDRRMEERSAAERDRKLALGDGRFECRACGNRTVRAGERCCGICGIPFRE